LESQALGFGERLHRGMTYLRGPLVAVVVFALVATMREMSPFYYGAPVSLFGEMIQMWASSQIRKDEKFTISGPYSHVRNPMYIGRFFVGLGMVIITGNPCIVGTYVVLFAIYAHIRVNREEVRLKEIFKPHYQEYCSEIHRWLPRFKAYSKAEPQRASWQQICVNHEQINLTIVVVVLIAVYVRLSAFGDHYWPR
jgi:hypothetical protein